MKNRIFFYPNYHRYVLITEGALNHMYAHIQLRCWQKEAGGELYAVEPDAHGIVISTATGPNPKDRRGRTYFNPHITATTQHREYQFSQGRHAVGLWHTHPEPWPLPSLLDRRTTEEYLGAFQNQRENYLMIILGNRGKTPNMAVCSAGTDEQGGWVELIEPERQGPDRTLS